jgi:hypothetical protein
MGQAALDGARAAGANEASRDFRFFRAQVTTMALVLVTGFIVQLGLGRSSFAAPAIVHVHAVIAMSWVGLVAAQAWLPAAGAVNLHRMLGKAALAWALVFAATGALVTVERIRAGTAPFFFQPQHFLIANPASLAAFLGLLFGAAALRRQTDWHARLQIGALAMLMGPGLGRLLPMPFLTPYAWEVAVLVGLVFPAWGAVRDIRVHDRAHPAWMWSIGLGVALVVAARLVAFSPVGEAAFAGLTAGSPVEGVDGLAFPPAPPGL